MILLILVIIGVILLVEYNNKKNKELEVLKENNKIIAYDTKTGRPILKKHVNITGYDTNTGRPIYEYKSKIIGYNTYTGEPIFEGEKIPEITIKKPLTEEDKTKISNTILMVTGAILVVFASIIFLASSWDSIASIIKVAVLIFVQLIFYLFSFICTKKLNIQKTGKIFNYLTLIFVPIILLSLSCFEIVGDYLSINGEGWSLFFGISFLITDIVYKLYAKTKNDLFLKRASLISEIISLIFVFNNLNLSSILVIFILSLHNIIYYILLHGNYLDKKAYKILNDFYTYFMFFILFHLIGSDIAYCTSTLAYTIFFFIKYNLSKEEYEKKYLLLLFFIAYFFSLRVISFLEIPSYFLYILALFPILYLAIKMQNLNLKRITFNIILAISIVIIGISILETDASLYYLFTYITGFILYVLMYLFEKKEKYKILSYIMFSCIFLDICYITELKVLSEYVLLIISILVYFLEILFDKLKGKYSSLFIIICLCIESIILSYGYFGFLPFFLLLAYIKLEKKNDDVLIVPMLFNLGIYELNNDKISLWIGLSLISIYTLLSINKKNINLFSIFSVLNILILCIYLNISGFILWGLLLIWGILHYLYNDKNNKVFKVEIVISLLGLYLKTIMYLEVNYISIYALGFYLSLISITEFIYKNTKEETNFIKSFLFAIITIISIFILNDVVDGILLIILLLILSIFSYTNKYRHYLYSSIICMIGCIILLTAQYWALVPWYIYILLIGLALIGYAMYDESKKQKKKSELIKEETTQIKSTSNSNEIELPKQNQD